MPVTPRPRSAGDPIALSQLKLAAEERQEAEYRLRLHVNYARSTGASIRVIAEHSGLSTRTVQDWLKQD